MSLVRQGLLLPRPHGSPCRVKGGHQRSWGNGSLYHRKDYGQSLEPQQQRDKRLRKIPVSSASVLTYMLTQCSHTHLLIHMHIHLLTHMLTCTYTIYMLMHIHTHLLTDRVAHMYIHVCTYMLIQVYTHAYILAYTHAYTYAHPSMHTYEHTCSRAFVSFHVPTLRRLGAYSRPQPSP